MSDAERAVAGEGDSRQLVQVRLAKDAADLDAIWPLVLAAHRETRHQNFMPHKQRFIRHATESALGKPDRFAVILAEWRGCPVGFLACAANRLLYCDEIASSSLGFYVAGAHRKTLLGGRIAFKLLAAYRKWAINRRAVEIQLHVTSGVRIGATDKFLRRVGFHQIGGNYALVLPLLDGSSGKRNGQ